MNPFHCFVGIVAMLVASFGLVGCNMEPKGPDGYSFEEPGWVVTDLKVKVVLVPSQIELERLGPKVPGLAAFAEVSPTGECTIYKVDSRVAYQPEFDGHELNHCIYGDWHPQQTEDRK